MIAVVCSCLQLIVVVCSWLQLFAVDCSCLQLIAVVCSGLQLVLFHEFKLFAEYRAKVGGRTSYFRENIWKNRKKTFHYFIKIRPKNILSIQEEMPGTCASYYNFFYFSAKIATNHTYQVLVLIFTK